MLSLREITKDSLANYQFVREHLAEDARLDEEALSKLPEEVFIGPGRTFPVQDLVHADAVRKVLDQMEEGEGLKSLLASFLDRRKAKLEGNQDLSASDVKDGVIDPGSGERLSEGDAASLDDKVAKLESQVEELSIMRDLLKRRGDSLEQDLDRAAEANLEIVKVAHRLMAEKIADLRVSKGSLAKDARDGAVGDLAGRTWESLTDTLADLEGQPVQDGVARETDPAAVVDDPTKAADPAVLNVADSAPGQDDLSKYKGIVDKFKDLRTYKGLGHANRWLDEQIRRGYFPAGIEIG